MKYIFTCFLFLFSFFAFTQSTAPAWKMTSSDTAADFYDIRDSVSNYYRIYSNQDTGEGEGQMQFLRWSAFWQDRAGAENQRGSFMPVSQALLNLFQNPVCTSSSPFPANWQLLGPKTQAQNTFYQSWCAVPPNVQTMGRTTSVAYDAVNNIIYAGTSASGLWKTLDGGLTWSDATGSTHLPGLAIQHIAIDPNSPNIVYIATGTMQFEGYGIGVLRSTDFGTSWNPTGLTFSASQQKGTFKILIDQNSSVPPNPSATLYALAENEVWKSSDAGTTWTVLPNATIPSASPPWNRRRWRDIVMKPGDANTIYISSDGHIPSSLPAAVWKTTDGGNTWTDITPSGITTDRISLSVCTDVPSESNSIWIYYNQSGPKIQKSGDGGNTWASFSVPNSPNNGNGFWKNAFAVSPTDPNVIYAGGNCMRKTTDGGTTWSTSSWNIPHMDVRDLIVVQGSPLGSGGANDIVIAATDGGVCKTIDGGITWQNINGTGLNITEFYDIGVSELDPTLTVGGTQDNGYFAHKSGNWSNRVNGDASSSVIDVNNSNYAYVLTWSSFPISNIVVYSNAQDPADITQTLCSTKPTTSSTEYTNRVQKPMTMHKNGYLYVGYHDIWKIASADAQNCNNSGWQRLSDFSSLASAAGINLPLSAALSAVAIAPSNPQVIYAAYEGQQWMLYPWTSTPCTNCPLQYRIFRTLDGGLNWTDITDVGLDITNDLSAVRWLPITDIVTNPENPLELWVSFGGFNDPNYIWGKVMHSSDGGNTWSDYTNGLTEFPVNSIVYEKGSNDGLYVGTDAGVFYTNKDLYQQQGWVCFNDNLPTTIITDLEINYASNKIRAATLGRGLWESSLACPPPTLTMTGNISSDFYEAEDVLITNATASTGTNIEVRGSNEIIVDASQGDVLFAQGSNVHLFIHGCNHSGNSFRQQNNNSRGDATPYSSSITSSNNKEAKTIYESENLKYTLYPNPFTDHLHIDFLLEKPSDVKVTVYNSFGQIIETLAQKRYEAGEQTLYFDGSSLITGVYFIKLDFGDKHYTKAVIKTK